MPERSNFKEVGRFITVASTERRLASIRHSRLCSSYVSLVARFQREYLLKERRFPDERIGIYLCSLAIRGSPDVPSSHYLRLVRGKLAPAEFVFSVISGVLSASGNVRNSELYSILRRSTGPLLSSSSPV